MGLRFTVLSSGSTGNATVICDGETKLLVDAGLSARRVEQLMKEREVSGDQIDAILVTHEHSDHIKGLGAIARKYDLPVYANTKTWEALDKHIGTIAEPNRRIMETGTEEYFGNIRVESYGISHDAAEPVGYCFHSGGRKLAMATDLGYMSTKVKDVIGDSDAIILEANHDIEMLRMGRYPWNIKRRILSDLGHLSNEAAGEALLDIMTARTRAVYMAHLSQNHNLMDLARLTLNSVLEDRGVSLKERNIRLMDTYFDRPTKWEELGTD
ncbi:MBL fold metallo-hydrolase [Paenibacillus chitinolyticus]